MVDRLRVRRADLSWEKLDDEVVILDLAGSNYLKLNGTGAFLWQHLLDGADRDGLVRELRSSFAVDDETASRDVDAFIGQLRDAGLLETEGTP